MKITKANTQMTRESHQLIFTTLASSYRSIKLREEEQMKRRLTVKRLWRRIEMLLFLSLIREGSRNTGCVLWGKAYIPVAERSF